MPNFHYGETKKEGGAKMTEQTWMGKFSDKLRDLLDTECMTQKDLVEESGLSAGAIHSYLNGYKMPGVKALLRLADVFEVNVNELVWFGEPID